MKKKLLTILATLSIFATTITGVYAASATFYTNVSTMQGYTVLESRNKSTTSPYGTIVLMIKDSDAVSFSAKCQGGSYGPATLVTKVNQTYTVKYNATYTKGTNMTARFRSGNWSLNHNMIAGTFDYK